MNDKAQSGAGTPQDTSGDDIGWMMPMINNSRNSDKCSPSPWQQCGEEHVQFVTAVVVLVAVVVALLLSVSTLLEHPQGQHGHAAKAQGCVSGWEGQLRFHNFHKGSGTLPRVEGKGTQVVIIGSRSSHPKFEYLCRRFRQTQGRKEGIEYETWVSSTCEFNNSDNDQGQVHSGKDQEG